MTDQPTFYGVWIYGAGWLRGSGNRAFAAENRAYAVEALRMCKPSRGRVVLIDESMDDLQAYFLENEKKQLGNKIVRFINGLFKRPGKQKPI